MRRAMMRPMSPEPRITTRLPGMIPSMFTSRCAVPAVNTPAGRVPGMSSAPRGRSLHPIASTMDFALKMRMPCTGEIVVTAWSAETSSTIVRHSIGIFSSFTLSMKRCAYSGPVSSSLKRCSPKPLWMHCCRMPPGASSRSRISTFAQPASRAATAAASPAGPAPITSTSTAGESTAPELLPGASGRGRATGPHLLGAFARDSRNASIGRPSSCERISRRRGVQKPP